MSSSKASCAARGVLHLVSSSEVEDTPADGMAEATHDSAATLLGIDMALSALKLLLAADGDVDVDGRQLSMCIVDLERWRHGRGSVSPCTVRRSDPGFPRLVELLALHAQVVAEFLQASLVGESSDARNGEMGPTGQVRASGERPDAPPCALSVDNRGVTEAPLSASDQAELERLEWLERKLYPPFDAAAFNSVLRDEPSDVVTTALRTLMRQSCQAPLPETLPPKPNSPIGADIIKARQLDAVIGRYYSIVRGR